MAKKSFSREAEETMENKETIVNEVPDNRYQGKQQVATSEDAIATKGSQSSFSIKKTKGKGSELKQQVISDVLTGSSNTSGMGVNAAGRSVSGTAGGILGAANSTPQADKSRSGSRLGKKLDRTATKLNYTPSEQVLLEVDESKPLADSSSEDQGYNGTYRNEFARSQKIAGAVPADLLYQRSVDLISKDKLYFLEGQMDMQANDNQLGYFPTKKVIGLDNSGQPILKDVDYTLGNYLHSGLHFGLDENGKVTYFYADVADFSATDLDQEDANMASAHRMILQNRAELDRMAMDAKAGDEKADIWSPIPRAVNEPTKTVALLPRFEAITGGYVHLAYSKATTNMSYQLNRGPKDGLDEITPAIEECVGWRSNAGDSITLGNAMNNVLDDNYIFNKTAYRAGDPTIMIQAYDSVKKYHNKADLLLQPRGWRMHLQTADNNMNTFKVPSEYANVFAATEAFSTIDHDYDPLLPICMTDKANLITPINMNEYCMFNNNERPEDYHLEIEYDTTNGYVTYSTPNVFIDATWAKRLKIDKIYVYYKMKSGDGYSTNAYPEYNSTTNFITLKAHSPARNTKAEYDFKILEQPLSEEEAAGWTTLINGKVVNELTSDIVFAEPIEHENGIEQVSVSSKSVAYGELRNAGVYVYSYSDLRNLYTVECKLPLIQGMIDYLNNSIGGAIRSAIDQTDFYIPMVFSTQYMTLAQIFICAATPWIARVRANSMRDVIYYEDNVHEYPFSGLSSLSSVPFKSYVNFDYSDYDTPLSTKVMNPVQAINWTMPEFFWKVATEKYVLPWYFNENDLNNDGTVNPDAANMSMPSIRSGVRLGLLDNLYGMSEKDIRLSLDRFTKYLLKDTDITSFGAYKYGRTTDGQILANLDSGKFFTIGKLLSCPRELGLSMDAPLGLLTRDPADISDYSVITTPLKSYAADGTTTSYRIKVWTNINTLLHPTILAAQGVNIQRAANYVQKWFEITANAATSNCDIAGLIFGMGDDAAIYSPFAALGSGAPLGNDVNVTSYQRSLNTRLQFLPFVISPFDSHCVGEATYDIYDFAYMFGLCGFRASDYRESVYNREKRVVNEGLLFVSDPWIEDSPILTGAMKSTGISISKGYELK